MPLLPYLIGHTFLMGGRWKIIPIWGSERWDTEVWWNRKFDDTQLFFLWHTMKGCCWLWRLSWTTFSLGLLPPGYPDWVGPHLFLHGVWNPSVSACLMMPELAMANTCLLSVYPRHLVPGHMSCTKLTVSLLFKPSSLSVSSKRNIGPKEPEKTWGSVKKVPGGRRKATLCLALTCWHSLWYSVNMGLK